MKFRISVIACAVKVACHVVGREWRDAELQRLRREIAAARAAAIAAAPPPPNTAAAA